MRAKRSLRLSAFLMMSMLLISAGGCTVIFLLTMKGEVRDDQDLDALYENAIRDASVTEESEVHELKPITSGRVTVVAWTDSKVFKPGPHRMTKSMTVTLVPEVQQKCSGYKGKLVPRLKQLLGMSPYEKPERFVEMEVDSADIYRLCPDPDVSKLTCGTQFPEGSSDKYAALFAAKQAESHRIPGGSPFTGLGYTYDWNPDTSDYGASEYLVRPEAWVTVLSVEKTRVYCKEESMTPLTPIIKRLD